MEPARSEARTVAGVGQGLLREGSEVMEGERGGRGKQAKGEVEGKQEHQVEWIEVEAGRYSS